MSASSLSDSSFPSLLGVIVFALYVVGVKLLPVSFSVEIGDIFAFAAASLAGWLGTGVLPQK